MSGKTWQKLREQIRRAWAVSAVAGKRPGNSLENVFILYRNCARRLWQNNLTAMSAALSFRTIFAIIPFLVLAFLVLKAAGTLENGKQSLRKVLDASGFTQIVLVSEPESVTAPSSSQTSSSQPASQRTVNIADEIEHLVDNVESKLTLGRLGPVGFILLVYTATTLLTAIELSLNRIFGATRNRPFTRSLPIYWSAITFGPILIMVGSYLGSMATATLDHAVGISRILAGIGGWAAPFLGCFVVLWALYKLLPNTEVPTWPAMVGAATAAPLWIIAKWGFALYVARFVSGGNLYGTLGIVPLFLIWLNVSWLIVLFGAEVAHAIGALDNDATLGWDHNIPPSPPDLLATTIAVAIPYAQGTGPIALKQIAERTGMSDARARMLLEHLETLGLICPVKKQDELRFLPARPLEKTPALEILQLTSVGLSGPVGHYHADIRAALSRIHDHPTAGMFSLTLADLVQI